MQGHGAKPPKSSPEAAQAPTPQPPPPAGTESMAVTSADVGTVTIGPDGKPIVDAPKPPKKAKESKPFAPNASSIELSEGQLWSFTILERALFLFRATKSSTPTRDEFEKQCTLEGLDKELDASVLKMLDSAGWEPDSGDGKGKWADQESVRRAFVKQFVK